MFHIMNMSSDDRVNALHRSKNVDLMISLVSQSTTNVHNHLNTLVYIYSSKEVLHHLDFLAKSTEKSHVTCEIPRS